MNRFCFEEKLHVIFNNLIKVYRIAKTFTEFAANSHI